MGKPEQDETHQAQDSANAYQEPPSGHYLTLTNELLLSKKTFLQILENFTLLFIY